MDSVADNSTTPAELGYRWPAEWEPHAATWLSWPQNRDTWPGNYEPVPGEFTHLVRTLAECEPVNVLAGGHALHEARRHIEDAPHVELLDVATNDAWLRDYGPTFLTPPAGQPPALVDWQYNAWGGKYPPFDADNAVPRQIAEYLGRRRFSPGLVLEGGAIDGNGAGIVLTTTSCLLDPQRNPNVSRETVEHYLRDFACAEKVLWLEGGAIAGDDTDGHIDQLARFVDRSTLVAAVEEDPAEENFAPLQENLRQLRQLRDQDGRPFEVVPLPMPRAIHFQGQRLPASYCNSYIANEVVVVPQFDDPADARALEILNSLFADRHTIGLPSRNLILGLGSFHCLTQQQPAEK